MKENNKEKYTLKQVEIRLKVKESDPLYSPNPIDSAEKAVKLLSEFMKDLDRECVYVINCDTKMKPISYTMAAMGGINYAPLDPGNIYKSAMLANASNIMVLHIHPSGNNTPSRSDVEMTQRTALAGAILGIAMQDHLIVAGGTGDFLSMRDIMPELFTDPAKTAGNRDALLTTLNMAVAEPSAAVQQAPPSVYNEVMIVMQRQEDLKHSNPEAWSLAGEVADIAYTANNMQLNTQDYETILFMVDTAERIREHDIDGIKSTLSEVAESSQDIALVRKTFQLIIRLSQYDGEWEQASEKINDLFDKDSQPSQQEKPVSLNDKLEAKSREADTINSSKETDSHLIGRQGTHMQL